MKTRLSGDPDKPMIIRLGHYYFDNKPLIGKMADVQVWDRALRYVPYLETNPKVLQMRDINAAALV